MKILALPRDSNPYQTHLYREMGMLGIQVGYLGEMTPIHTLNLLLLPIEVLVQRLAGARVVHIHWVFGFRFAGATRIRFIRRLSYGWFVLWLRTCNVLQLRIVWTAHNILPHEPVFIDDPSARRALVLASDLVVAHSKATFTALSNIGALPRRGVVIPHGPLPPCDPAACLRLPRPNGTLRHMLFVGRIQQYKGIEDLLDAYLSLPTSLGLKLTIAGACDDRRLLSKLSNISRVSRQDITLLLRRLSDQELTQVVLSADAVVLPFRKITTSGSAILALSHGRPLIIPDLEALADVPTSAAIRYERGVPALAAAMTQFASSDDDSLRQMSGAALQYAYRNSWCEIASRTAQEMERLIAGTCAGCGRGDAVRKR